MRHVREGERACADLLSRYASSSPVSWRICLSARQTAWRGSALRRIRVELLTRGELLTRAVLLTHVGCMTRAVLPTHVGCMTHVGLPTRVARMTHVGLLTRAGPMTRARPGAFTGAPAA
jgi:hypothetical protein